MNTIVTLLRRAYELLVTAANLLQSPLLLALRLYFFWQLFLTGKGKLSNIGKVSEFFASLGIPMPNLNAYFIGSLECFGSLLLIIGLGSQPLALLIVLSMVVAYLTADFEAVSSMFSDPDKFAKVTVSVSFSCLECSRVRGRQILGGCADKMALGEICREDTGRRRS